MGFHYKKKHYKLKIPPILITLLSVTIFIIAICYLISLMVVKTEPKPQVSSNISDTSKTTDQSSLPQSSEDEVITSALPSGSITDWNLLLLNRAPENKIDGDLDFEKVEFDDKFVDARTGEYYQKMYDAAKEEGITLFLRSGYRLYATQLGYYEANIENYMKAGNTKEEAIRLTELYYAIPGHSEHQSGLAFDIITPEYQRDIGTLDERFEKTDAFAWLTKNGAEYGFILRYPKDKVEITQINYEPWHYRYVGAPHAKYMQENNLCLEEYLQLVTKRGN